MIERALSGELGGTATMAFDPAGLVCNIEAAFRQPKSGQHEQGDHLL